MERKRMKLRSKKTGEIGDLMGTLTSCPYVGIGIDFHDGNPKAFYYSTLTELNEEWEDFTEPAQPLIKDEKIRKAVRAWAEAIGARRAYIVDLGMLRDESSGNEIKFNGEPFVGWVTALKTITELCGEEEE